MTVISKPTKNKPPVNFLVDTLLTERSYDTGFPSLEDAAKLAGYNVHKTKYVPFSGLEWNEPAPFGTDKQNSVFKPACVVTHGTIEFCNKVSKTWALHFTPGMYFNKNVKSFAMFAAYLGPYLLNDEFVILPFKEAVRRCSWAGPYFIKPESGMKEFVGQVVDFPTYSYEEVCQLLNPYGEIDPQTLCVIAPPREIKAEFRYVIANRKVITGSEYRWDDVLDVRIDTHPACDTMAKAIAELDWQADTVYVCDIALTKHDAARVIELNAFSSSGLYACDTHKIVEAVAAAAWAEHCGNDD